MFKALTKGGQTTFHNIRMSLQILRTLTRAFFGITFVIMLILCIVYIPHTNWYFFYKYIESLCRISLNQSISGLAIFSNILSNQIIVSVHGATQVIAAKKYLAIYHQSTDLPSLLNHLIISLTISIIMSIVLITLFYQFLYKRGQKLGAEINIRGASKCGPETLKQIIENKKKPSEFKIGDIPYVKGSELQHTLITGSVGTGKTVLMSSLISQARSKNHRMIIYDKMGVYTERFFRPGKDILLNPLDARSVSWNVWAEVRSSSCYDTIAESLIAVPTSGQDPFWAMAARVLFSVVARKLGKGAKPTNQQLLKHLLLADSGSIQELVKFTEAESLVASEVQKMALSVKAYLCYYIKSMRYLSDEGEPFSIRSWVEKDDDDSCIFITSRGDQHSTLKPLISTFLDVAASSLLSLRPNLDRRVFLFLDEVPTLQNLPSLPSFLAQSRQFGGAATLTIQNIPQFRQNFGDNQSEVLIDNCNTTVHFRSPGNVTADYVSRMMGNEEISEATESISMGANHIRDGVSMSHHKKVKPIVMPSEIKRLNDLECFLRMKGDLPVTKLKLDYLSYESSNKAFEPRDIKEQSDLIEKIQELEEFAANHKEVSSTIKEFDAGDAFSKYMKESVSYEEHE